MRTWLALTLAALSVLAAACAGPVLTQETTFDGLVRIEGTGFDQAFVRPDLDIYDYTKLLLEPTQLEYRPQRAAERSGLVMPPSQRPITDEQKKRLRETIENAFLNEVRKGGRLTLVSERGPGTFALRLKLVDVVAFEPPKSDENQFVLMSPIGEATLVLELRDAQSEAILARVVDRGAPNRLSRPVLGASSETDRYEVSQVAFFWAELARKRLNELPQLLGKTPKVGSGAK